MADFNKPTIADIAQDTADINAGTTGKLHDVDWGTQDAYWRDNYQRRPYIASDRGYDFYRGAYRYGAEASGRYANREWSDVEPELERDWKGEGAWEHVKAAVRDAFDRMRGR
jgi:hypothetical protein